MVPDPLVRLLIVAIALATVLPVRGRAHDVAQVVSSTAVFLLFLLNGLRLPRHEVIAGLSNLRMLGPLLIWVFGAMTLAGLGLSHLASMALPVTLATGFLFLGALPSTVQSATAYSSLAGGNVAASVIAAAVTNILGVFVTAPLFTALAGGRAGGIDASGVVKVAMILLLPFALGQIAQGRFGHYVREHRQLATWMDRTSIAIAVYVAFSGAVVAGLWTIVSPGDWGLVVALDAAFLVLGFGGAWLLGGALRLDRPTRITMLYAGGQKSIAMGAPLAAVLFKPDVAGMILVPVLVYHLSQLVISAPLATRLNRAN